MNFCVVPAKAGTHTPYQLDVAGPLKTFNIDDYGPRFRGDDKQSQFHDVGFASAPIRADTSAS
jgi:hypothetical protein